VIFQANLVPAAPPETRKRCGGAPQSLTSEFTDNIFIDQGRIIAAENQKGML